MEVQKLVKKCLTHGTKAMQKSTKIFLIFKHQPKEHKNSSFSSVALQRIYEIQSWSRYEVWKLHTAWRSTMKKRVSYVFCNIYSKSCQETASIYFKRKEKKQQLKKNLKSNPVLNGTKIIPQVNRSCWLHSRHYPLPVNKKK